jgi:chorismate synthase
MNTYGDRFRVTTYGESHGPAVGAVIDGCPAGLHVDFDAIAGALARRREGAPRQEEDNVEWLSGIRDGITLGTPIAFYIRNNNTRPQDYIALEHLYRPGHADYTYQQRFGTRDYRGGGRASARETVSRVVAGEIAKQIIAPIMIEAVVDNLAPEAKADTRGGIVACRIDNLPAGVGNPVFGKLNAALANAMMSIPSAIGFEMGAGFAAAAMNGSKYIDRWNETAYDANMPLTKTNHCGGIQGGISNGMPIEFRVAFHPVATLPQPIECMHEDGHLETVSIYGRHDYCHIGRTTIIVEAMAALCIANFIL